MKSGKIHFKCNISVCDGYYLYVEKSSYKASQLFAFFNYSFNIYFTKQSVKVKIVHILKTRKMYDLCVISESLTFIAFY